MAGAGLREVVLRKSELGTPVMLCVVERQVMLIKTQVTGIHLSDSTVCWRRVMLVGINLVIVSASVQILGVVNGDVTLR